MKPYDLVLARTLKGGIGKNNHLPWKLPNDLRMFKKITTSSRDGNTVIYGRKTYESLGGKALPNRLNIVLSRSSKIEETSNIKQAGSLKEALDLAYDTHQRGRVFVTGGSKLFEEALPDCSHIYQTLVAEDVQCDVFAPKYDSLPCNFISKTYCQNNIRFDYRHYYNPLKCQNPMQNLFIGAPEHEEYQYLRAIKNIIQRGQEREDRTNTGTKSIFGGMMRYDLSQTFPLLTHKKVFWRGVAQELLWFLRGSTDAEELEKKGIHIWAGNSSKEYLQSIGQNREAGDLGPVYGFQWRHQNAPYIDRQTDYTGQGVDQLAWIINQLKTNPSSRHLILSARNPSQLNEMALPPYHSFCQFHVTQSNRLNCLVFQNSCNMGLGVPFNIASYSLLTCLIAQVTGLERGQFVHMMGDMHVYKDHIEQLRGVDEIKPYPFPVLHIDKSIKDIGDFKFEHLNLSGYKSHKKISMKMAV